MCILQAPFRHGLLFAGEEQRESQSARVKRREIAGGRIVTGAVVVMVLEHAPSGYVRKVSIFI